MMKRDGPAASGSNGPDSGPPPASLQARSGCRHRDGEVIEGDCLDVMRGLPDAYVDAVVTDPPYGIGFGYVGGREECADPESYWAWLSPRYDEMLRVLKPGGFIAIWQAAPYFKHYWSWFGDDIHIYAACKNFIQVRKVPINYAFDPVVMRYKVGGDPLRPEKPGRNMDFFVANTASIVSRPDERPDHPCPRPLDQMREVVANFTLPGGSVLDPFAGSGTTGVACVRLGRRFLGIEREEQYAGVARHRIRMAQQAHTLNLDFTLNFDGAA